MESVADRLGPVGIALWVAGVALLYLISTAVYAIYFHPLSKIPGPWYAAVSRIPYARRLVAGQTHVYLGHLHAKYGNVVRYSPNEVSFINGDEVWPDAYGFRTGKYKGTEPFEKDPIWAISGVDGVPSIVNTPESQHGRQRRLLSHAFSDKSLRNQEPILQHYADLLINQIKAVTSASTGPTNMTTWYNWVTFDIIADLVFGEPFGCLASCSTHEYVELLLRNIESQPALYCTRIWPWLLHFRGFASRVVGLDLGLLAKRAQYLSFVKTQTTKRIEAETERHDFMTDILEKKREAESKGRESISIPEIFSNSSTLLAAGTETTATVLAVVTYLLLTHPEIYDKVKTEVRGRFASNEDITIEAANGLEYTIAVLTEAMRWMPAVPAGFIRKVPKSGAMVGGYYLPGNCNASVSMTQHTSYRSERNFREPNSFIPERWLPGSQGMDGKFKDDIRSTYSPFSYGPRNCLGKNLAYAEMRLILAKIVFHFDMELEDSCQDWAERCELKALWKKPSLLVKVTAVA